MTEDNYRRIKTHYKQGLTATETWRYFLDNHDSWIPPTTITAHYITLAREPQPAESSETPDPRAETGGATCDLGA